MKLFLLKDAPDEKETLCNMITEDFPNVEIVGAACDSQVARGMIESLKPELILFDTEMQDGQQIFELLKESRELDLIDFDIIFLGTNQQHNSVIEVIKDSAVAFLTKPLEQNKLREAIGKAMVNHNHRNKILDYIETVLNQITVMHGGVVRPIAVPLSKGVVEIIQPDEIAWLESKTVYTDIHLRDGQVLHAMRNIGYFRDQLIPHFPFFQISQQAIIHLHFMRRFIPNESQVVLKNGHYIHVSRIYGRQLRRHLQHFDRESATARLFKLLKRYFSRNHSQDPSSDHTGF